MGKKEKRKREWRKGRWRGAERVAGNWGETNRVGGIERIKGMSETVREGGGK